MNWLEKQIHMFLYIQKQFGGLHESRVDLKSLLEKRLDHWTARYQSDIKPTLKSQDRRKLRSLLESKETTKEDYFKYLLHAQLLARFTPCTTYSLSWNPDFIPSGLKEPKKKPDVNLNNLDLADIPVNQQMVIVDQVNQTVDYAKFIQAWNYDFLPPIRPVNRPKNPLGNKEQWQKALFIDELSKIHINNLSLQISNIKILDEEVKLGIVVMDLLINSQIYNQNTLYQLLKQLLKYDFYQYQFEQLFFYCDVDGFNAPNRIFISPHTETLIYRFFPTQWFEETLANSINPKKGENKTLHKIIMSSLKAYLQELRIPVHLMPTSVFGWCRLAELGGYQYLAPIFIQSQSGHRLTHSLPSSRLHTIFNLPNPNHIVEKTITPTSNARNTYNKDYGLQQLNACLDQKSRKSDATQLIIEIEQSLNTLIPSLSPNTRLLALWSKNMLRLNHHNRFEISPIKIKSKISSIGRHILNVFNNQSIVKMDAVQRANSYQSVIEQAISERNKNTIAHTLRGFNQWLEGSYISQTEEPESFTKLANKSEVFGNPSLTDMTVNANLITHDEYHIVFVQLKDLFESTNNLDDQNHCLMMLVMLILGFRCGLRSSEVFYLKWKDWIVCEQSPILIVRESYDRELKTINAKRQFTVNQFLTETEIGLIQTLHNQVANRLEKLKGNDKKEALDKAQLFCGKRSLTKTVTIASVKTPLMQKLVSATKCPSLTFHHLRHSFASWHFLSATIAELDLEINEIFKGLPKTEQWLMQAQERKLSQLPTQEKSKKYLFWIAQKMGHLDFATTFQHYIHTADVCMLLIQNKQCQKFTTRYWSDLSGASNSYLHRKKQDKVTYASKYKLPEALKNTLKESRNLLKCWTFDHKLEAENSNQTQFQDAGWHQKMQIYQNYRNTEEHSTLSTDQKRALTYFKKRPHIRLRALNTREQLELQDYVKLIEEQLGISLEQDFNTVKTLRTHTNIIVNGISPESASKDTLKTQRDYHWRGTNVKHVKKLVQMLNITDQPYRLILQLKKELSRGDKTKNKDNVRYWAKSLGVAQTKIEIQASYPATIGEHGAIEVRPLNAKGKRNHVFFYFWVSVATTL